MIYYIFCVYTLCDAVQLLPFQMFMRYLSDYGVKYEYTYSATENKRLLFPDLGSLYISLPRIFQAMKCVYIYTPTHTHI
jgi:hypothetical protein